MKKGLIFAFISVLIIPAVFVYAARLNELQNTPIGPVNSRDVALLYVLEGYPELSKLGNPSTIRTLWHEENLTPKEWVGSSTVQYVKGD